MAKFERNHSKLSKIRKELDKAPQEELIQPTIALLSQLNRDLGKLQEKESSWRVRLHLLDLLKLNLKETLQKLKKKSVIRQKET